MELRPVSPECNGLTSPISQEIHFTDQVAIFCYSKIEDFGEKEGDPRRGWGVTLTHALVSE